MRGNAISEETPLRIAHVTPGLDMGGLERLLVEFARHADRRRHELRFVCLGGRGRLAEEVDACGWPVEALNEPDGLRPGLVVRLARRLWRWGVDVVHTHDDRPLIYGAAAARLARVRRVIHTRHGKSYGISRRSLALVNAAARLADRVVCVSEDCARMSVEQGMSPRRVCALWNGIDVGRFAYAGPCADGPVVTVARLSPEKDVENLVMAAAVAAADSSLRVEVAGDGPCLADLKRLAGELGVEERVCFLGEVRDVPGLLARASLFVLPSRSEGISLTLLEAMARGLPVVATEVGGTPEVVVEGETGLLVPAADPAALASSMLRLKGDPDTARRMGLAGRRRVERWFDVRRMVAEYEALYRAAGLGKMGPPASPWQPRAGGVAATPVGQGGGDRS